MVVNSFNVSSLVSTDVLSLLSRDMDAPFLNATGNTQMGAFDDDRYIPGQSISYQVSGIPTVTRGDLMQLKAYEQRTLFIKADTKRWYFSVTKALNQTSTNFEINKRLIAETISAPALKAIKEKIELEACQWALEHSPVFPQFSDIGTNSDVNADIVLPMVFNSATTNWLNKLRRDIIAPTGYRLILNSENDKTFSDSLVTTYSTNFVEQSVKSGSIPKRISDFESYASPYLRKHTTTSPNANIFFETVPTSDENPTAVLRTTSATPVTLKAGDIIYYKRDSTSTEPAEGIYWTQNTVKRAIPDARYSFVVTSDKFIEGLTETEMQDFSYEDVEYTVPASMASGVEVSLSHKPIAEGYFQNSSREIVTGTTAGAGIDTSNFAVLDSHMKNVALHPSYFKFKCFKLEPLKSTENSIVNDSKTGLKMLITHDRVFADASRRGNILDISTLPCFGAVSQNLFTLPIGIGATPTIELDTSIVNPGFGYVPEKKIETPKKRK